MMMSITEFRKLAEERLREAESGDPNLAPFGMSSEEAFAWLSGQATALHWALEMLPAETRVITPEC